jgi:hypothetical protein
MPADTERNLWSCDGAHCEDGDIRLVSRCGNADKSFSDLCPRGVGSRASGRRGVTQIVNEVSPSDVC